MCGKFLIVLLLPLAACASLPPPAPVPKEPSACDAGENTYACQVERYHNTNS